MVVGAFDIARDMFYQDVADFKYDPLLSNIIQHPLTSMLECWVVNTHRVKSSIDNGACLPLFFHCPNTTCEVDVRVHHAIHSRLYSSPIFSLPYITTFKQKKFPSTFRTATNCTENGQVFVREKPTKKSADSTARTEGFVVIYPYKAI